MDFFRVIKEQIVPPDAVLLIIAIAIRILHYQPMDVFFLFMKRFYKHGNSGGESLCVLVQ